MESTTVSLLNCNSGPWSGCKV